MIHFFFRFLSHSPNVIIIAVFVEISSCAIKLHLLFRVILIFQFISSLLSSLCVRVSIVRHCSLPIIWKTRISFGCSAHSIHLCRYIVTFSVQNILCRTTKCFMVLFSLLNSIFAVSLRTHSSVKITP